MAIAQPELLRAGRRRSLQKAAPLCFGHRDAVLVVEQTSVVDLFLSGCIRRGLLRRMCASALGHSSTMEEGQAPFGYAPSDVDIEPVEVAALIDGIGCIDDGAHRSSLSASPLAFLSSQFAAHPASWPSGSPTPLASTRPVRFRDAAAEKLKIRTR